VFIFEISLINYLKVASLNHLNQRVTFGFDGESVLSISASEHDFQNPAFSKMTELMKAKSGVNRL
jgi:hypothetical protein